MAGRAIVPTVRWARKHRVDRISHERRMTITATAQSDSSPSQNGHGCFFQSRSRLSAVDAAVFGSDSTHELKRQQNEIELIASENIVSMAVLEAQGSACSPTNTPKATPASRYYGGCQYVDEVERLAIERACKLFDCSFANVQPHSGANANQAVFMALLQPGDVFMGMDLAAGGHLTHGSPANQSGKWFKPVAYTVRHQDHSDRLRGTLAETAEREKPKLIIAGGSAYSRHIDFKRFREIADSIGAYLMVDMAHFAGLVAGGVFPSSLAARPHRHHHHPQDPARTPRRHGALHRRGRSSKKINSAVFPGLQGGPLMHVIAAKAVAFGEALQPEFKTYAQAGGGKNAKVLADTLVKSGVEIVSGGTDSHLMLVDLQRKDVTGKATEAALGRANVTCNKNGVPFDPKSRLRSPRACAWAPPPAPRAALARRSSRPGRRADHPSGRRPRQERRGEQRRRRGRGEAGSAGPYGAFPHLWVVAARPPRSTPRGLRHA